MLDRRTKRLLRLMDRERAFLVEGDLDGAARLMDQKERLLAALDPASMDRERLDTLARAAARNDGLIVAAREGIAAAQERLRQIRRGPEVGTYMANGTKETIRAPMTSLRKRA